MKIKAAYLCKLLLVKLTLQIAKKVFLTPLINYQHCAWTGAKVKCGLWTTIVNPRIYDGIFLYPKILIKCWQILT